MVSSRKKKIRKIKMIYMLSGCEEKMKRNKIKIWKIKKKLDRMLCGWEMVWERKNKKREKLKRILIKCDGLVVSVSSGREI